MLRRDIKNLLRRDIYNDNFGPNWVNVCILVPKDHVFPWYWHLGLCICSWFDNLWFLQANIKNCRAGTIFYTDFNHRKCITYALSLLKYCLFFDHEPLICSIHSVFNVIMLKSEEKTLRQDTKIFLRADF